MPAGKRVIGEFLRGENMRLRRSRVWVPVLVAAIGLPLAGPVPSADALSQDVDPGFQTNGRVTSIVTVGNTVYIAGAFTTLRPAGAPEGSGGVPRNHLAALGADNGNLRSWNPETDGTVSALALSPNGRTLYVGGHFAELNGKPRHNLGAVSTKTGKTKRFRADTNAPVLALTATKSTVYLGGVFTRIKAKKRNHVGAVNRTGHVVSRWRPRASGVVRSLAMSRDRHKVYVGGDFTAINRHRNEHLAAIGAVSGKVAKWKRHPGYAVWDIEVRKHRVYLGGNGTGGRVGAFTPLGKQRWAVQTDGGVQAIAYIGGKVVAGGHFEDVCVGVSPGPTPGFNCPQVQAQRLHLLALSHKKGKLKGWNPPANSQMGVFALTVARGGLFAGGDFTQIAGVDQQGLARFPNH